MKIDGIEYGEELDELEKKYSTRTIVKAVHYVELSKKYVKQKLLNWWLGNNKTFNPDEIYERINNESLGPKTREEMQCYDKVARILNEKERK